MQKIDHAEILSAYLCRLTLADIDNIARTNRAWTHAAMNYGNSAQDSARAAHYDAVCNAINNLLPHDRDNISKVIQQVMERVTC